MINGNITEYLNSINESMSNYYVDAGVSCEIQARNMFSVILDVVNYSLFCGAVLLLFGVGLILLLDWFKHRQMSKMDSVDEVIKLLDNIGMIQRVILFVCFMICAWLLQIAVWGL